MAARPTGTVTFLFTDVEGSTRLWEDHEEGMRAALEHHDEILRSTIEVHGGYVFSTAGDAFAAAFDQTGEATDAARAVQEKLAATSWPPQAEIRVRMGMHTGEAHERDGDYFGPALNRAARIMSAGHGGQVLVSSTTAGLMDGAELVDLGEHRLKDLGEPEQIFQIDMAGEGFAALRTLSVVRHNLPVQRTPLVGRDAEIGRVVDLVAGSRLVTLTGIGGVGKTRLALAAAASVAEEYHDGVFFVDLAPLGSGEQLPAAVADAIGLQGVGGVKSQVLEFLAARRALVILDNCEHLIDDVAEFVDRVLDADGESKLLTTSREDLDVEGERTLRVSSLPIDLDANAGPAMELLIDRAEAAGAQIVRTGEPARALSEICARLDGIPLAIELAAAQLAHLSPADLLGRLDQRFDLLSGGRRRRRQRQQTLQAVMDWSWELLTEPERALLAKLAVFAGPWDLVAAEGICSETGGAPIVSTLGSLVHKSLVQRVDDRIGGSRYRMLETVRLYAQQQLVDRGDADELRDRLLAWYVDRIESEGLDIHMLSLAHIARYTRDWSNIRAAIEWAITTCEYQAAATLVIAGSAQKYMPPGANCVELIDIAEELLELDISAVTRARLLVAEAWLYWTFKPDPAEGLEVADRAVDAARKASDPFALAQALWFATFYRTDRLVLEAYESEAVSAAEATGSPLIDELVNTCLHVPWTHPNPQDLLDYYATREPDQEHVGAGQIQGHLGVIVMAPIAAQMELAHLAADRYEAIHDRLGIPGSWQGPYARSLLAAADRDLPLARSLLEQARKSEESSRVGPTRGDWLLVPALVAAREDRFDDCARLLQAVRSNPMALANGGHVYVRVYLQNVASEALDADQLAAARETGRHLDTDTAIADFMSET